MLREVLCKCHQVSRCFQMPDDSCKLARKIARRSKSEVRSLRRWVMWTSPRTAMPSARTAPAVERWQLTAASPEGTTCHRLRIRAAFAGLPNASLWRHRRWRQRYRRYTARCIGQGEFGTVTTRNFSTSSIRFRVDIF